MRDTNFAARSSDGPGPDRDPRDEPDQIANGERRRTAAFVSGIVAVIGAWVALSPFVYGEGGATLWNNAVVGATVLVVAGYNVYRQYNDVPLSPGAAGLATLLGLWLIVAAAALGMVTGAFWSTLVSGLLIAALAGYNTYEARDTRAVTTEGDAGAGSA
ncbi:SPW repeat protein [Halovivax sp.]|uniref:SPW repeat protein n=1 Tax=Halovivax sp. TaxID=1935978 RepID=UPI0025C54E92|nr:SPW repeat protein [Halovivax sp.]